MPRMTRKRLAAFVVLKNLGLNYGLGDGDLYQDLETMGYHWNSKVGEWKKWASVPADESTDLVMVRLWCASEVIVELADDVVRQLKAIGLHLVEASEPYPCHPPKQLESRVYLKFFPERKLKDDLD
jgi:hypothetical protein